VLYFFKNHKNPLRNKPDYAFDSLTRFITFCCEIKQDDEEHCMQATGYREVLAGYEMWDAII